MGNTRLGLFAVLGAITLTACARTELPPHSPVSAPGDVTGFVEPSRRDPLGYTGRPVDSDPYSSELDGQGLPGPFDMTDDDAIEQDGTRD